jgi:hypothetical protein
MQVLVHSTNGNDVYDFSLSAYNADEGRIPRLRRVWRELDRYGLIADRMIGGLHDHKGLLTVNWLKRPTDILMQIVEAAWERQCEHEVEHVCDGKLVKAAANTMTPYWD